MPKLAEPLTTLDIENTTPKQKQYKISDGGNLYLLVTPTGGKLWRFNYQIDGKRKTLCLKSYPDISLDDARKHRDEARQLLTSGVDPAPIRKQLATVEKLERQESQASLRLASVRINIDGVFEIWKGKNAIRLTNDEALFIKNQLCRLID